MGLDHQRVERKPSATACSPWPSTLLILDIKVPSADVEKSGLWLSLGHAWPNYLAYAISFLTIGVMWVNHHTLLSMVTKVDHALLYRNILLLGVVSFIPFPTAVLSEYVHGAGADDMRAAVGLYGLAMIGLGAAFTSMWAHLYPPGRPGTTGNRSGDGPQGADPLGRRDPHLCGRHCHRLGGASGHAAHLRTARHRLRAHPAAKSQVTTR